MKEDVDVFYLLHGRADRRQHLERLADHVDLAGGLGGVVLVVDGPGLLLLLLGLGVMLVLGVWRHGGGGAVVRPGVRGVGVDLGVHCQQRLVRGRGGHRGVLNIAMREKYLGWTKISAVERKYSRKTI